LFLADTGGAWLVFCDPVGIVVGFINGLASCVLLMLFFMLFILYLFNL